MESSADVKVLEQLPDIEIWGDDFERLYDVKYYKGKFVMTSNGKLIAKLLPKEKYDKTELFHNTMLTELGVKKPESAAMKKAIIGGGKIELELIEDYVECRLYGSSTVYGDYDIDGIDQARIEKAIEVIFNLGMMPVLVIPNFGGEI